MDRSLRWQAWKWAMLALWVLVISGTFERGMARPTCTAASVASGVQDCLAMTDRPEACCSHVINDIVHPCGIARVCSFDLGSEVIDFFGLCNFKCRGLAASA